MASKKTPVQDIEKNLEESTEKLAPAVDKKFMQQLQSIEKDLDEIPGIDAPEDILGDDDEIEILD